MTERLHAHCPVLLADSKDRYLNSDMVLTIHGCETGDWLQYWLPYPGDPDHAGVDLEMVMFEPARAHEPLIAVYAQHKWCRARPYQDVDKTNDGHPIVYVGRDKHASYFRPGWHRHGRHFERSNGQVPLPVLLMIGAPRGVHGRRAYRDPDAWVLERLRGRLPHPLT